MSDNEKSFIDIDKEIRALQRRDFQLNSTNLIIKSSTFSGITLYGERRIGKSVLGLLILYEIYQDWDIVMEHVFFDLRSLITFLMKCARSDYKCPCLMFDDAGVNAGTQMYNVNRALTNYMGAMFDVIGTVLKSVILTTPDSDNLMKSLRRANFYKVRIEHGTNEYDRRAIIYKPNRTPYDQFFIQKVAIDQFDVRLPTNIYQAYYQIRKSYTITTLTDMETALEDMEKGKVPKGGEHADVPPSDKMSRKEYQRHYQRDYLKGKSRIRKADWQEEAIRPDTV